MQALSKSILQQLEKVSSLHSKYKLTSILVQQAVYIKNCNIAKKEIDSDLERQQVIIYSTLPSYSMLTQCNRGIMDANTEYKGHSTSAIRFCWRQQAQIRSSRNSYRVISIDFNCVREKRQHQIRSRYPKCNIVHITWHVRDVLNTGLSKKSCSG